jgi:bacillithiol synthase
VKAHCLPFSQIPHTTRLFADFLSYSPAVRSFYPHSPNLNDWLTDESKRISFDASRRKRISDILERQNEAWGASPETLASIKCLRQGAAAIVTGQQVGLFGGPMFTIYKALTAVRLAEEANRAGVDAVPIFWLATYDHDLAEINHVSIPEADGALQVLTTPSHSIEDAPVSAVPLGDEIQPILDQAAALLGETEATGLLRESYRPGETLGTAFARLLVKLFAEWGVIVLDASDPELHRIAEPIYLAAVERAAELEDALLARGTELESAGYHQQVKVTSSSVLLFMLHNGARTPIQRRGNGADQEFVIGSGPSAEKISRQELLARISAAPERFSPNVLLRPIVEDYLLPTLAYTGGAAEVAYFGQAAVVYERLLGRVTPVIPRYSATIVEPKTQRLLEKYGLAVTDAFTAPETFRQQLAARGLPRDLQAAFDSAKKSFDSNFAAIKEKLGALDRTLVDAADTASSKMQYQLDRLYQQAARAESQKSELVSRHAETLSRALYPEKGLQERTFAAAYFAARYGRDFLHQICDSIQPDCHDHQILEV